MVYSSLKAPCEYTLAVFMYYLLLSFEYFSVYALERTTTGQGQSKHSVACEVLYK